MFSCDYETCLFLCLSMVSASVSITITHRSAFSTVAMIAMLVLPITVEGWPDHRLSSVFALPSLTVLLSRVAFPQTSFNEAWIIRTVLTSKISILMYACCFLSRELFCFIFGKLLTSLESWAASRNSKMGSAG